MSDALDRGRKIAEGIGLKLYRCPQYGFDEKQVLELLGNSVELDFGYMSKLGSEPQELHATRYYGIPIPLTHESEERKMLRRLVNAFKTNPTQYKMQDIAIEAAEKLLAKEQK